MTESQITIDNRGMMRIIFNFLRNYSLAMALALFGGLLPLQLPYMQSKP